MVGDGKFRCAVCSSCRQCSASDYVGAYAWMHQLHLCASRWTSGVFSVWTMLCPCRIWYDLCSFFIFCMLKFILNMWYWFIIVVHLLQPHSYLEGCGNRQCVFLGVLMFWGIQGLVDVLICLICCEQGNYHCWTRCCTRKMWADWRTYPNTKILGSNEYN